MRLFSDNFPSAVSAYLRPSMRRHLSRVLSLERENLLIAEGSVSPKNSVQVSNTLKRGRFSPLKAYTVEYLPFLLQNISMKQGQDSDNGDGSNNKKEDNQNDD